MGRWQARYLRLTGELRWRARRLAHRVDQLHAQQQMLTLIPHGTPRGRVLQTYWSGPLEPLERTVLPTDHANLWGCREIARIFLDLGFIVDVVRPQNSLFIPKRRYDVLFDDRRQTERLAPLLGAQCVRICFLDTSHILFHDTAELTRLLALQRRRGVTLRPRRYERPTRAVEHAHHLLMLGNDATESTYAYLGRPIRRVPVSPLAVYPWPERKDFASCRRRFVWIASAGMVHKGLDLVLEAFAQMPDLHLSVCGPVESEVEFVEAYRRELFETPNIELVGWVDVTTPRFTELADSAVAVVLASCSEGQNGGVLSCMHAGLIPIITAQAGVDHGGHGIDLHEATVAEIIRGVRLVAELEPAEAAARARGAWDYVRAHHTGERYAATIREALSEILGAHGLLRAADAIPRGKPAAVAPRRGIRSLRPILVAAGAAAVLGLGWTLLHHRPHARMHPPAIHALRET